MRELFHVGYWLARTYARGAKPGAGAGVRRRRRCRSPRRSRSRRPSSCSSWRRSCASATRSSSALLADKDALDEELERLRAEVAEAKKASGRAAGHARLLRGRDPRLLHRPAAEGSRLAARPAAGPRVRGQRDAERRGQGLRRLRALGRRRQAARAGRGQAHASAMPRVGQQQAKLYADCLEQQFGQRPVIFYSNGYEHWLWDDASYPPRAVQGFYKKAELELLIQRRDDAASRWRSAEINAADRRALLPDARHPPHRRGVRARPRAQGAARDGDRRGQDAHGHRAVPTC